MREIHTIDPGRYEEGSRPGTVRLVGMIGAQELFDKLKAHLEAVGLMPDEYFLPGTHSWNGKNPELPEYRQAVCHTNWGGSEGIYIGINLQYLDDNRQLQSFHLATGKTLGSSGDDFLHMSRIATECLMMLNGWGTIVKVNEQEAVKENNTEIISDKAIEILENMVNSPDCSVRCAVAKQGYALDRLVHDEAWHVRDICAAQGVGQNVLVNDPETQVRETLAKNGYALDVLINDEAPWVRYYVASHGYGLDKLISDESEIVRACVATHDRPQDLSILINDESPWVRQAVARQGYGLDKLIKDSRKSVRFDAENYLEENNLTLSEWKEQYPDRCVCGKKKSLESVIEAAEKQSKSQAVDKQIEKSTDDREGR